MCILLQFPSPDDPRPEPPAGLMTVPRRGELSALNVVSVRVPGEPSKSTSAPSFPPVALRGTA
jgi:hypothetical protein